MIGEANEKREVDEEVTLEPDPKLVELQCTWNQAFQNIAAENATEVLLSFVVGGSFCYKPRNFETQLHYAFWVTYMFSEAFITVFAFLFSGYGTIAFGKNEVLK